MAESNPLVVDGELASVTLAALAYSQRISEIVKITLILASRRIFFDDPVARLPRLSRKIAL
jgi:hypothetical protein